MADQTVSTDVVSLTVLAFLTERPMHPYDVQRVIRQRHKDYAIERPRALYRAFERLARDELIEPVETSREGRRPERTVYQITDEGRTEFSHWLLQLLERPVAEDPVFAVAVGLLGYLNPESVLEALNDRFAALEGEIAGVDAALQAMRSSLPRLVLLAHEYRRALRQAERDWVLGLIQDIRTGSLSWDLEALSRYFASVREGGGQVH
jgi:DNA-binding PadR family transcriptional regulator